MKNKTIPLLILSLILLFTQASEARILSACTKTLCGQGERIFPVFRTQNGVANINYKLDQGPLGDFTNQEAQTIISEILDVWNNLSESQVQYTNAGFLDLDVNGSNHLAFTDPASPLGFTPIIFDDTGDIIDDLGGQGLKEEVLGFAATTFISNPPDKFIEESQVILNGHLFKLAVRFDIPNRTELETSFKIVNLHEFGHVMGLDHLQGGYSEEYDKFLDGMTADFSKLPIMFPIALNPSQDLLRDDIGAAGFAYPSSSFTSTTGTIEGTLTSPEGEAVTGANLTAFKVDSPDDEFVSSSSDIFFEGDGKYNLPGLVPGDYIIKVEPVGPEFFGASSVGQYDPLTGSALNDFVIGFYNGSGNTFLDIGLDEALLSAEKISVAAGQTIDLDMVSRPQTAAFQGKVFKKSLSLRNRKGKTRKKIKKTIKVKRLVGDGDVTITLSTDHPELVEIPSQITLGKKNAKFKLIFKTTDPEDFSAAFPLFLIEGGEIKITGQVEGEEEAFERTILVELQ